MEQMLGFHEVPPGTITSTFALPIQSILIAIAAIRGQLLNVSSGFMPPVMLPLGDMT